MDFMTEHYLQKAKDSWNKLKSDQRGLQDAVNIVLALVMIVVVGAIGIFVADKTVTATGTPANSNLSAMQTNLLSAGQTGSSFVVILVISFIGGIAIAYMFGMLPGQKRR
jgi:ABC-type multidrug transport system permease subunit